MRIAFLGTGIMGGPMASNLAAAGHDVTVWNRTREKAEGLGAAVAGTPAEAVDGRRGGASRCSPTPNLRGDVPELDRETLCVGTKDVRLALAMAEAVGLELGLAHVTLERFERAIALGHSDEDAAAAWFASRVAP